MNNKLNEVITFEELGGALVDIAQQEAQEAVTRTIVGLGKAKGNIKKTAIHVGKAVVAKTVGSYIDNTFVDTAVEIYAGVKLAQATYTGYKAIGEFKEGYDNTTDQDVSSVKAYLNRNKK